MRGPDRAHGRLHRRLTLILQAVLLVGIVLALWERQWLAAVATTGVVVVTLLPLFLGRRFRVLVPPEFEFLAIVFVFASLFLGEVRGYYVRFWWWDAVLHAASGFLLGILGFLLVYVLNETEAVDLRMKPAFVAFFAFTFSVAMGAAWEIFEFAADSLFGLNMQRPRRHDVGPDRRHDRRRVDRLPRLRLPPHRWNPFVSRALDRPIHRAEPALVRSRLTPQP